KRTYRYIISTKESNPFESRYVTFLPSCDLIKIKQNISLFEGEHNFEYFEKTGSDTKTTIRTIYKAFAYTHKSYIILHYEANGFLRSQIRLMTGALLSLDTNQITEMLQRQYRYKIKPVPPQGLYLAKIKY
ncbi:MAG: tRNA pseudouridine synthase A, partial [Epsilonproteobacteria bacterium]|nr:tRNA pseudouridine synthase A [Campylobacterota bacterium]